jgi:glycosyltransferase involved in cell wall biosynthesis
MHILLIDDSVPFDGFSPAAQPLGGPEKAFASLPGALARRGHEVHAINRCLAPLTAEAVRWLPWETPRPPEMDILIAFRKPALLDEAPARHKFLWVGGPAKALHKPPNQTLLDRHRPTLVFLGPAHRRGFDPWRDFRCAIVEPGVREEFRGDEPMHPLNPPTAVVTTHPSLGLDRLIEMWVAKVRPQVPQARLRVFSTVLDRGRLGGEIPVEMKRILAIALGARDHGVVIERPMADSGMAEVYRAARLHLYPGTATEIYAWTLAESQSCGLPAVARAGGAADERIRNGQTGYLVPDDDAIANVTRLLLTDDAAWQSMSRDCRLIQRQRGWDQVAAEFEVLWQ